MEHTEVECSRDECAFKRKEMKGYPTPCKHCNENKKRQDDEGCFYVGKVNY